MSVGCGSDDERYKSAFDAVKCGRGSAARGSHGCVIDSASTRSNGLAVSTTWLDTSECERRISDEKAVHISVASHDTLYYT